jgi:DNA-binding transcriptional LysR family regulator
MANMDSNGLKIFLAVAEEGSVSRAAERLHCVQSNVTAHIRKLETDLGTELFHRTRKGMGLSAAGNLLLPYARSVAHLLHEARAALEPSSAPRGPLRLGAMDTAAVVHLPALLAGYHQGHPDVDLQLTTGASGELVARVLDYSVEGAFVGGQVDHPDIVGEEVLCEELVVVTSGTELYMDEESALSVLVYRSGCSCRRSLEDWLKHMGRTPSRVVEMGALDAILGCVGAGMGITMLPRSFVTREPFCSLVHLHAVPPPYNRLPICFVRRRDVQPSPAMRSFLSLVRETLTTKP